MGGTNWRTITSVVVIVVIVALLILAYSPGTPVTAMDKTASVFGFSTRISADVRRRSCKKIRRAVSVRDHVISCECLAEDSFDEFCRCLRRPSSSVASAFRLCVAFSANFVASSEGTDTGPAAG